MSCPDTTKGGVNADTTCMDIETCGNGHPRTPENTGYRPDRPGRRYCRECVKESQRRRLKRTRGYGVGECPPRVEATHCRNGHAWDEENTYSPPGKTYRQCRQCIRDRRAGQVRWEESPEADARRAAFRDATGRTHCTRGHALSEDNLYRGRCRICRREQRRSRAGYQGGAREVRFKATCKAGHDLSETRYYNRYGISQGCGVCQAARLKSRKR